MDVLVQSTLADLFRNHLKPLYSGTVGIIVDTFQNTDAMYLVQLTLEHGIDFEQLQRSCATTGLYTVEPHLVNYGGLDKGQVHFRLVLVGGPPLFPHIPKVSE